ncbi:MAG: Peptidoglycan binding protein [Parcubacteria group bacterium Athens0714_24]|nr:MAG: Peptidoglycan binding protein [Parcubacteria group bacterium Athens0714_24]
MPLIFLLLFLLPIPSFADVSPTITSFTASPSAINSGYTTILSWTMEGSSGNNLYFNCPLGVKIIKTDGTTFPCNQRIPASSGISDSIGFNIINVSGGTVVINATVYPKDLNGADYDAGAKSVYITANTTPHPITDFYSSATTVVATTTVTLSWVGHDVSGTNLQFDCIAGVQVFVSGDSTQTSLPCNTPVFSSSLGMSGSSSFTFTNSSLFATSLRATILPMIATGLYDATHALSLSLDIAGKPVQPSILIDSFNVSNTQISSGNSLVFSWSAPKASGVNFQITCSNSVSVGTTTSSKLPCNTPAFSRSLPTISTITLYFLNNFNSYQYLSLYLLPQNADGTYDGTKSKKLDITVIPAGQNSASPPAATPPSVQTGEAPQKIIKTIVFTQSLKKGSRGNHVTGLQKFLAQNQTLYPEGLITGYFGLATERAIKRFQEKYNIAKQGEAGYGTVGPKTRAKLNSLENF